MIKYLLSILLLISSLIANSQSFTFDAGVEGWTFTSGGKATGTYDASGYLDNNSTGRNNSDVSYWQWSGTWEDLGVTPGDIVTDVNMDIDWSCYIANVSDGYTIGPVERYFFKWKCGERNNIICYSKRNICINQLNL